MSFIPRAGHKVICGLRACLDRVSLLIGTPQKPQSKVGRKPTFSVECPCAALPAAGAQQIAGSVRADTGPGYFARKRPAKKPERQAKVSCTACRKSAFQLLFHTGQRQSCNKYRKPRCKTEATLRAPFLEAGRDCVRLPSPHKRDSVTRDVVSMPNEGGFEGSEFILAGEPQ